MSVPGRDRGGRSLTWEVTLVFVGVVVVTTLAVGALGFFAAREMLGDQVESRLQGVQNARVTAIERGLQDYRALLSGLASDPALAETVVALEAAYEELGESASLTPDQDAALDDRYEQGLDDDLISRLEAVGLDVPSASEVTPRDPTARYLQYHYLPSGPDEEGDAVVDPGDGSQYSALHRDLHPVMQEVAASAGFSDLAFVSAETGRIYYTVQKSSDLGADVLDGPYGDGGLRNLLVDELPRVPVGETVLVDFAPYLGNMGAPTMFAATAVRDGQELVGVLVGEVDIDVINNLMTGRQEWEASGFGETGESYVVGDDGLLRSDARPWLEDPAEYLERVDSDLAAAVEATGSTVLIQPAETDAVEESRSGDLVSGRYENYLGDDTLTVAGPIRAGELDWVVVADLGQSEADDALNGFLWRTVLVALILLPVAVGVAVWLARRLVAPVPALEAAASAVAAGDLDVEFDDRSADELGDLGRELRRFATDLEAEDASLAREEARLDELLLAALPPRAVGPVRSGDVDLSDVVDTVTVVVLTLQPTRDGVEPDSEQHEHLVDSIRERATEHGLEQVITGSDRHVFVAGLDRDDHRAADAARFALDGCADARREAADGEFDLDVHAVATTGRVAMGVVSGEVLSFSMWGEPARIALELDALAQSGEVLITAELRDLLGGAAVVRSLDRHSAGSDGLVVVELVDLRV